MYEDDIFLSTLGRHVPRVLKNQLISKLANQYAIENGKSNIQTVDSIADIDGDSTISRFHSAMLFVDISGFTVLSQKLKVDDLKVQINNYFELIVSIILKYDGEIIKFAGDAIFVIFQTKINNTADPGYFMATKEVIDTAVVCGKEVLAKCGHYPVELGKDKSTDSTLASMELFESMDAGMVNSAAVSRKTQQQYAERDAEAPTVTYLDVHCGVSVGTMAGIDVGAAGRSEYLIMGQPMSDVAIAEGDAGKGELVISPEVHNFLHRYIGPMPAVSSKSAPSSLQKPAQAPSSAPESQPVPSPAKKTAPQVGDETGFFCFKSRRTPQVYPTEPAAPAGASAPASTSTAAPADSASSGAVGYFRAPTKPDTPGDTLPCGCCVTPAGYFRVNSDPAFVDKLVGRTRTATNLAMFECREILSNVTKSFGPIKSRLDTIKPPLKAWSTAADVRDKVVETHYRNWARDCLVDDIAHHVHEVSRENYTFMEADRFNPLASFLSSDECTRAMNGESTELMDGRVGFTEQGKTAESLQTISELRNVIVMFINVKMDNSTVFIDPHPTKLVKTCAIDEFNFLSRTEAELQADKALRNKFQSCFAVMAQAFADKGGQVRQFIVDDKGTVCIGTFGLRGAVNYDNAAASVETAELIINGLQALGIGASIGLTSGTGYCGLVGSTNRHEYAVMGPSVNLSARLMCRAALGEAICDADTRSRDRTHNFTTLASVQAKGYAHLVPTFKPNFNMISEVRNRSEAPDLSVGIKQVNKLGKKQLTKKNSFMGQQVAKLHKFGTMRKLQGREHSMRKIVEFLFPTKDQERFTAEFFASLENDHALSPAKGANTSDKQSVVFDISQPTRLVSLVGPHGIGKTSMLDLFQDKMSMLAATRHYNLQVFRHRVGYVNTSSPFSAFMCMIFHMMFYTTLWWAENVADEATRKAFVPGFNNLGVAIEYTFSKLSPELQRYRPLLCDLHLLAPEPDNEFTELLKGKERLYRTADLLAGYIQQYSLITGKFALMIMDDIQNNDSISQYLFKKVWTEVTGVGILSTYRPKGLSVGKNNTGMSTPTSVSSRATTRASSSDYTSIADIPVVDFLAFMGDTEVFRRVDLQTIDKAASNALVADIFELFDITDIDDTVYDKMYELSGGNPLYATELSKGIAQKRSVMVDTQMSIPSLNKLLAELRTVRVEEVVYYRFDQLEPDWQMVLKVAAVAASNNAPFTAPMLQFMIDNDKSLNRTSTQDASGEDGFDLQYIINYMLSMNEFIYIKNMSITTPIVDRGNAHTDFEPAVFNSLSFAWHFVMEQKAVYDLMLDEQKISLHTRMVEYLQSTIKDPTTNDLFELAHHMDLARNHTGALRCYYQSGMMLHAKGVDHDALKHFTAAQRMLAKLRSSVGITDEKNGWRNCTVQKMQEVFGSDTQLVEVAIQSVLRTAQSLFIFLQGDGVDEQLRKLAHRNARTFFEQAMGMIAHACSECAPMPVDFSTIATTFWDCIATGGQTAPPGVESLSRVEAHAAMADAVSALKASAPIAEGDDEEEEGGGDRDGQSGAAAPEQ